MLKMVCLMGFLLPCGPLASPSFLRGQYQRQSRLRCECASVRASEQAPAVGLHGRAFQGPAAPPRPSLGASAHVTARRARLRVPRPVATAPAASAAAAVGLGRVVARLEPEPQ